MNMLWPRNELANGEGDLTMHGFASEALRELQYIIEVNKSSDWRVTSFADPSVLRRPEQDGSQNNVIPLLNAYQRILRILPVHDDHLALPLLRAGFHSAIQIANMRKPEFARRWAELFPDDPTLADTVYQNAVSTRSRLLLHHINTLQSNEPHYRAARFR
jgi:hypothetical protein